ncbi:MAG: sulfatase-like hydrolase/transferase [Provencibacterium sp.]|jgi:arylsulfatase|nr:sulfatase-like hydrolase/transferase [Provencibacterium sp.]
MSRPNILWICTDQQRSDTLGCYGNEFVHTPRLDGLAQKGVLFTRAYSQSPVCTPSRASFLTGRYPRATRCRQNGQSIPPDEKLVSKLFAEAGYNCGLAGKLHISACHASVCRTTERRIDDGYSVFHWSHHPQDFGGKNGWANNEYHIWLREQGTAYRTEPYEGSQQVQAGMPEPYHQTRWCADRAIDFIRANAAHRQPWFFSLNFYDPHHPFDPPREYLDRYRAVLEDIPLPNYQPGELENKNIFQQRELQNGAYNNNRRFRFEEMTGRDHRLVRAAYWAMVDLIDCQVGRILEALEACGEAENTLVIFTSDHGEMLGDHGIYLKGPHFYDCCVRVPLILALPGSVQQGVRSRALVELTDLAPTLLEAAGLPVWPGMQGRSFWPLLTGKAPLDCHREDVLAEYLNAMPNHRNPSAYLSMLRDERYKLIRQHGGPGGELYDLENDPNETHNLWDDPAYAQVRIDLTDRLCDRIAFTCDPLPEREAGF